MTNSNATVDANNTLCSGSTENNVWVYWVADFDGDAYINLQNQDCIIDAGMQMSIFEASASCPNSSSNCVLYINPANDDNFFGSFTAVSGSTYYIQLDGYAGAGCSFDFCITDYFNPDCVTVIPLPVDLIYFKGERENNSVLIEWATFGEFNCDYFEVERSPNGVDWNRVSIVNGSGNSTSLINYETEDYSAEQDDLTYYKLRQVDFDGKSHVYGPIAVVAKSNDKQVVKIINLMGVEVEETTKGINIYIYDDGTSEKRIVD